MKHDSIWTISLFDGQARALLAATAQMAEDAREIHGTTPTATAALGRLTTAAAMMGVMLKQAQDRLTLSIQGGGPAGALVATSGADARVKAYLDNPRADAPLRGDGKLNVGAIVGSSGHLRVIKDMGMREPYIGQVNLVSGEIGEDVAMYFTASEQTPSLVSVGVLVLPEGQVLSAGGVIVQPMPGCTEEALRALEGAAPRFSGISAQVGQHDTMQALAEALFEGMPWKKLDEKVPLLRCDCSRERLERVLVTLGREELSDMAAQRENTEVSCHFCRTHYAFTPTQIGELLALAARD